MMRFHKLFCAFALALCAKIGVAQCSNTWVPGLSIAGVDSYANAMVRWDPDGLGPSGPVLVVAGQFTVAGAPLYEYPNPRGGVVANGIVTWDGFGWNGLGTGMSPATVLALAVSPTNELYAAGTFTSAGGQQASNVAKWDGTAWQPLGVGLPGTVRALAFMPNGTLIAGGIFTVNSPQFIQNVAQWDGTQWLPMGQGASGAVLSLINDSNGQVIAGGQFMFLNGNSARRVGRWTGTTWEPLGGGVDGPVNAMARMPNGDIVVSGDIYFPTGGINSVLRWNGTSWSLMGTGTNGSVYAMQVLSNGHLILGGSFSRVAGLPADSLARWNGSAWSSFSGVVSTNPGQVLSLAIVPAGFQSGQLVVGGLLSNIGAANIAIRNNNDWYALSNGIDGSVRALSPSSFPGMWIGGSFRRAHLAGGPLARVDGGSWAGSDFLTFGQAAVNDVKRGSGSIAYVGGSFTEAIAVGNNIARYNGSAWQRMGSGLNDTVNAIAVTSGGDVIAGGWFSSAGGVPANYIARWNGTAWSAMGSGFNNRVHAVIVTSTGEIIAGGAFGQSGGTPMTGVARWNGSSWVAMGNGLSAGIVYSLAVASNGDILAGGSFQQSGFTNISRIARWNGTTWSQIGDGLNSEVSTIAVRANGEIIAGGWFTANLSGTTVLNRIARFNGTTWQPFESGANGVVSKVAVDSLNVLHVGGAFSMMGGKPAGYYARWEPGGVPRVVFHPTSASASSGATVRLTASGLSNYPTMTYRWLRNFAPISNGPGGASAGGGTVSGATGTINTPGVLQSVTLTIANVRLSDANGDFRLELTDACGTVTSLNASVSVTCAADYNSDTTIDFFDYLDFVADFSSNAPVADFNADTTIDFFDYLDFVAAFSVGC